MHERVELSSLNGDVYIELHGENLELADIYSPDWH